MTSKLLWLPESGVTLMTTELNSLANNVLAVDAGDYDNATNKFRWGDFLLFIDDFAAAPTAGGVAELHIFYKLDGTNYADGEAGDAASPVQSAASLHGVFPIDATDADQYQQVLGVPLRPFAFRAALFNDCGVAFGATGNILGLYPSNEESQ
jgi:hypothetical protein